MNIDKKELKNILSKIEYSPKNIEFKKGEIFPTDTVPIIISNQGVVLAKWGFPRKNKKGVIINARLENLYERIMFKDIIDTQRCIIPASAYFEWKKTPSSREKEGKYIIEKQDSILYMAGLYDTFSDTIEQLSLLEDHKNTEYLAFTIITKEANHHLSNIHHRMPLTLNKGEAENWLKGEDISNIKPKDEDNLFYSRC